MKICASWHESYQGWGKYHGKIITLDGVPNHWWSICVDETSAWYDVEDGVGVC